MSYELKRSIILNDENILGGVCFAVYCIWNLSITRKTHLLLFWYNWFCCQSERHVATKQRCHASSAWATKDFRNKLSDFLMLRMPYCFDIQDHEVSNLIVLSFLSSTNIQAASLEPPQYPDEENTVSNFPFSCTYNTTKYILYTRVHQKNDLSSDLRDLWGITDPPC